MNAVVAEIVNKTSKFKPPQDSSEESKRPAFAVVPIGDLDRFEPTPPAYAWEGLAPLEHVTLWSSHGGVGKTTCALMLGASVAAGRPLFGADTMDGEAVFYSGEDGASRLRRELSRVCRGLQISAAELDNRLHILDATEDPTLYAEINTGGRREGTTTEAFAALREFLANKNVRLLVIDNASDVYDASEIERAKVRAFMRALASLAREFNTAVILLAHVDKWTSRGERTGTESYTGSTAWHNSARSRLFMSRDKDGSLVIEHQKHNLGPLHEPIRLSWPAGGLPQLDAPVGPVVQGIADRNHERALLRLIAEFSARGEHVSAAITAKTNAPALLGREPSYPRLKPGEVFDLLRRAERAGWLERAEVRTENRKSKEVWQLTETGRQFAGLPAAPLSARALTPHTPRAEDGAHGAPPAPAALTAHSLDDGADGADGAPSVQEDRNG